MPNYSVIQGGMTDKQRTRKLRKPVHTFSLATRPFSITPFLLAPVLPGETMENFSLQARVVSDPMNDKLGGAHLEWMIFYVKLRDLVGRDSFEQMLIDPAFDPTSVDDTGDDTEHYFHAGGATGHINWSELCYARVVDEYFRGEEESVTDFVDGQVLGMAKAQVSNIPGWLDSLLPGDIVDVMTEATGIVVTDGTDDFFSGQEIEDLMMRYQLAKQQGLTQKSFEDYLAESGVSQAGILEPHVPELLAQDREWTYPTNVINESDGAASSAWVWSAQMRRSTKRFFTEPGFLYGVTITRPKVYYENLEGHAASQMNSMERWLTPDLRHFPDAGRVQSAAASGQAAVGCDTEKYEWNVDDLLMYGDQWNNIAIGQVGSDVDYRNHVALPVDGTNIINSRYPPDTDINNFFVDSAAASGLRFVRYDGIVNLSINSYIRESSTYEPAAQV